jgi:formylglycine-generating enzyme required for sulfatase activity
VLVHRADTFLANHAKSQDELSRILTLKLATVREDEMPTRRRALRSEFSDDQWRLVSELADHPNRLLITVTPPSGETYAEVAHEAIFWGWSRLRDWIAAEREFLAWKTGLEAARRAWQRTPDDSKDDALLMGAALMQAQRWYATHAENLPKLDREFIAQSVARENKYRGRARRVRVLTYALLVSIIVGLVAWINQSYLKERINWFLIIRPYMLASVRPYVLSEEAERALEPLASFRECAKECPEMIVIPAGEFTPGPIAKYGGAYEGQDPKRKVTIVKRFAVSRFDVTFADWDICVANGGCDAADDSGFGRGARPVINVSWEQARRYVAWFSRMTGRRYHLLTEAEWEYAARAGTTTTYWWGEDVGEGNANCNGCGGEWTNRGPSPVNTFKPNGFGLYDVLGNVWQWIDDCYEDSNIAAGPFDPARVTDACTRHVIRGGSWGNPPPKTFVRQFATGSPPTAGTTI